MSKIVSTNPSKNYEIIGEVESSTQDEINSTVAYAKEAQIMWASLSLPERCKALTSFVELSKKHAEEIAKAMASETGMLIATARGEVATTVAYIEAHIEMADEFLAPRTTFETDTEIHRVYREPWGVIAAIAPWNYPFLNIAFQCSQALLAGNAIVYKSSEEDPLFSKLVASLMAESSMPEGVFNIVCGDGQVGGWLAHADVDMISFTGSTSTGEALTKVAAEKFIPIITEMGGSVPLIVFEDIEITDELIEHIFARRFAKSGQNCDAVKRVLVHESKFKELTDKLAALAKSKKVGDALDESSQLGPLVAERQIKKLETQVKESSASGAKVLTGGKRPDGLQGAYYEPTIIVDIKPDMPVWREETFGPVLPIVAFDSEDKVVRMANHTKYGLGAHIFTHDKARFERVAKQIQSGMIGHNQVMFWSPKNPFGGYKHSGMGRTSGLEGFLEVTQGKLISEEK